jgi:hypothetical protein
MTGKDAPARAGGPIRALAAGSLALLFILDPSFGSLTWLNLRKAIVRNGVDRRIVAGIEDGGLVVLEFSKDESRTLLRWEHFREFEYDGRMYDVVETWAVGDKVYYRCWWDREETELNDRMRALAARALGDVPRIGDPGDERGSSLRSSAFLLAGRWPLRTPGPLAVQVRTFSSSYTSVSLSPPSPPPWPA